MKSVVLVLLIIVIAAALSTLIRYFLLNRLSRQLYDAAYVKKDKELFEILINSLQAQMVMSDVSREIMSLNFYISMDDENKVIETAKKLIQGKMNMNEAQTVYPAAIGYLCEKENEEASIILNNMKSKYAISEDLNMMLMMYDCELTYDVYVKKDTDRIKDIEEILKSDIDSNSKAVYQYRLAKLYYYDKNKDKAIELLNEARNNTNDKNAKSKIDRILSGKWDLL